MASLPKSLGPKSPKESTSTVAAQSSVYCAWQVTVSSATRLVPDWASGTAYLIGQVVLNGGNLYRCRAAGTSAGSGGPTGTGADITDNTAHWAYVDGFYGGFAVTNADSSNDAFIGQHNAPTTTKASACVPAKVTKTFPYANPSAFYGVAGASVILTIEAAL